MKKLLLILLIATSVSSFGQATLVKDIGQGNNSSSASRSTLYNGTLYFSADDGVHGRELWKTDGTASGTVLFKEFAAGTEDGIAKDFNGLVVNGILYFLAWDGTTFNALWKTDGTDVGTVKIKTFPDVAQYANLKAVNLNGSLIISVEKPGYNQSALWVSDGTEAGTTLLKNTKVASQLIVMNNEVFFEGDIDDGTGAEFWKTDGTVAGTVLVKDINPNAWGTNIKDFRIINTNTLIFTASDSVNGNELWKSDGTAAGTTMIKDINSGITSTYPREMTVFNNEVYFGLSVGSNYALWKTDGTDAGTIEVKSNIGNGRVAQIMVHNSQLYIFKNENSFWISDGTTAGTASVTTTYDDFNTTEVTATIVGAEIYFSAKNYLGNELWKTDGTVSGTIIVKDISPNNGNIRYLKEYNGQAIFVGGDNSFEDREIWTSDGRTAGTVLLKDINQTGNKGAFEYTASFSSFNNKLLFGANNHTDGNELWSTDGTTTTLLKDINTGFGFSSPSNFIELNGILYFKAKTDANGFELWKTDGSLAGTSLVKDINTGVKDGFDTGYGNIVVLNNKLYFFAYDTANGFELWESDGTEAGTVLLKDIAPGSDGSSNNGELIVFNNKIYFSAYDNFSNADIELWVSNGTAAGTVLLKNINPNSGSFPNNYTIFNSNLYFTARDGTNGEELWKTDGTDAGTVMIKDINVGSGASGPSNLTIVGNELFFAASNGFSANGQELWKTDGTNAGTVMVKDMNPNGGSQPSFFINHNGVLFFYAYTAAGYELWKSDGTEAGTQMVIDLVSGTDSSAINGMVSFGGSLLIATGDSYSNIELWTSDGTGAGTVLFQDINPSVTEGSSLNNFFISGTALYFTADDGTTGTELYKLDQSALSVEKVSKEFTGVSVFPNPTNGILNLKIENQDIKQVKVYSLFGKEVMRISAKNNVIENINLQHLSTGMYVLKIKTISNTYSKKVIKR